MKDFCKSKNGKSHNGIYFCNLQKEKKDEIKEVIYSIVFIEFKIAERLVKYPDLYFKTIKEIKGEVEEVYKELKVK
jgi:hypothetical protein